ncbi:MAG: hypothetical protein SWH68_01440 [Thermodesulfobacteriota bacterium]|nr:hypothetical protein [Thermodesulfobacteriota bacterium]
MGKIIKEIEKEVLSLVKLKKEFEILQTISGVRRCNVPGGQATPS